MKNRLTTLDIAYLIHDLRLQLIGLRVDQIYDIDKKTYLLRFVKSGVKKVLLLESGTRFHTTTFEWPKNPAPSGFAMKLRKHLNNKRLEKIEQIGADRIVDLQFGTDLVAHHLILELYDKGNILLTDHSYTILSLVRPRIIGEERLAAHETYAKDQAKTSFSLEKSQIEEILKCAGTGTLRDLFMSKVEFGPALFTHLLKSVEMTPTTKVIGLIDSEEHFRNTLEKLYLAFEMGRNMFENIVDSGGIIVQSKQAAAKKPDPSNSGKEEPDQLFYDQFHPTVLSSSFEPDKILCFESFNETIDEFFSKVESQKIDMKTLNQEREAIKKLEKVKLDQQKRLQELQDGQETDRSKAELISVNQATVDMAISAIRKLVANQISWDVIEDQLNEARLVGDPLALMIAKLNLKQNSISLKLSDPYDEGEQFVIDVDLNLSAFANATKYFDLKKASAKKEERTIESQGKAFKSTERKTLATLKEVATIHSIKKARKVLWFEKFRWFVTSENFLVIGGRDAQQNELLVKKYLRPRDVYMHADAHGAPTLLIKNDNPTELVSPKSLNEAGVFAIATSASWESKVVTSSWWVWGDQVSKSAPSGEYLPTGSFMIRGKKNYLPPSQLVLGFGFLFRLTEDCIEAHKNERGRRKNEIDEPVPEDVKEEEGVLLEEEFPDTHVDLKVEGNRTRLASSMSESAVLQDEENEDEFFVTTGLLTTINSSVQKLKNKQKKAASKIDKKGEKLKKQEEQMHEDLSDVASRPKRGQHGRKKKLKEKYKFQDDEERQLRMQILKTGQISTVPLPSSKATEPESSKPEETDSEDEQKEPANRNAETGGEQIDATPEDSKPEKDEVQNIEEDLVEEEESHETELDLLKSLTGSPLDQDELLYAVPVVAPYTTLQNYKFRIKMTPGTTKRGRAAKMALESFLRDKEASPREKDLIKAVKDQDLARNFPGKVKLSNIIREKK